MADVSKVRIWASYDDDASMWFVSKSDVKGLSTEAASLQELHSHVEVLVPELLVLNHDQFAARSEGKVSLELIVSREVKLPSRADGTNRLS